MTKADEACVYSWRLLSYPLWKESRPQFEFFTEVGKMLEQHCPFVFRTNFAELQKSGDRKSWLEWRFDGPINERLRMRMHLRLVEVFGEEQAGDFRWEGSRAKTEIGMVIALGEHLQGGQ